MSVPLSYNDRCVCVAQRSLPRLMCWGCVVQALALRCMFQHFQDPGPPCAAAGFIWPGSAVCLLTNMEGCALCSRPKRAVMLKSAALLIRGLHGQHVCYCGGFPPALNPAAVAWQLQPCRWLLYKHDMPALQCHWHPAWMPTGGSSCCSVGRLRWQRCSAS